MARAPINGATLTWARSVMHLDVQDVASAAGTTLERTLAFESGDEQPTLKQLEKIAKKLDRTMAFFFAPPPTSTDVPQTPDFRGRGAEPLPPLLAREMRRAEQHRDTVLDLQGAPKQTARVGSINWDTYRKRASELRTHLGLCEEFVPSENSQNQVLNFWRGLLEHHGYLVFQTTKVPLSTFRGLSIQHDSLPVIILNGSDSNNGKVFTLFHEVAHLANKTSGLCDLDEDVNEEAIANAFAANFLMPYKQVTALVQTLDGEPSDLASRVATRFKVSFLAAGIRLRTLNVIDDDDLEFIWRESDAVWAKNRADQKARTGGPAPWRVRYRDLGRTYIGTVARAVEDSRVDWMDASYLLNARIPMVRQMFEEYYRTEGSNQ
ncbi:hypothetical protein GY12_07085 [Micrococcus luteus]|nr:hypothetical protein GY12_07085 [Micrococcus luteus]